MTRMSAKGKRSSRQVDPSRLLSARRILTEHRSRSTVTSPLHEMAGSIDQFGSWCYNGAGVVFALKCAWLFKLHGSSKDLP